MPWRYHQLCSEFKGDAIKDELAPWRREVPVGSYVARTGRETQNARRGQLRPGIPAGHSPLKREDPTRSTQARKGLAVAA